MLDTTIIVLKFLKLIFTLGGTALSTKLRSALHNLSYKETASPRNVVVIGASFAGCEAARVLAHALPSGYKVVLVEKSSHFQFTWVFPRFSVVGGHEHKAFIPYSHILDGAPRGAWERVQDTVTSIGDKAVVLQSGAVLEYEYLVIATGSRADAPSRLNATEKEEGIQVLKGLQEAIRGADRVVVVGGGPAGVEIACDAKDAYPKKDITLIHSRPDLLHNFGQKLHDAALAALEKTGVRVILNDRAVTETDNEVVLKNGEKIPYDLLIRCTGQKAASDIVADLSSESLSPSGGYIKVKSTLQIADGRFSNVYAAGDVADINGPKNGRAATFQAAHASENILRSIRGTSLLDYSPNYLLEGGIELTLGLENEVLYITDGARDTIFKAKTKDVALKSMSCWKKMGATPYVDDSDSSPASPASKGSIDV